MKSVRLVVFDLGGVIVRIQPSWKQAFAAAGIRPWSDDLEQAVRGELDSVNRHLHLGRVDVAEFARVVAAATGGRYSVDDIRAVHRVWILEEYPALLSLIARVKSAGMTTALLSNTNHAHWEQQRPSATVQLLDHHFVSHQLSLLKPEPAIYAHVEKTLGCTAEEILFFDDTPENVAGARARSWRAVVIDPTHDTAPQLERGLRENGVVG